jgi:hypothetical protein
MRPLFGQGARGALFIEEYPFITGVYTASKLADTPAGTDVNVSLNGGATLAFGM